MLTQDQRDTFRKAAASWNCCGDADVDIDDMVTADEKVVETRDTVEDFFSKNGRRLKRDGSRPETPFELEQTAYGPIYVWSDVQSRPGKRRGTLLVMDFGDARAAYFDGEV